MATTASSDTQLLREHRDRLIDAAVFGVPRNVYSKRWTDRDGQASLGSALASFGFIASRRKQTRAVFELLVMFGPIAAVAKHALRFFLAAISGTCLAVETEAAAQDERPQVDALPRPEPPSSKTPQAKPNAPNS